MNKAYFKRIVSSLAFQYSLLFIIAVIIWQISYPALMSPDSLAQYEQSQSGIYNDWHPPIMAIILRAVMKLGGNLGVMTLIQCLAALFGLRSVISLLIVLFANGRISRSTARIAATLITIIFLIPILTPYMFFSVIFWTDAWVSIAVLWVLSYVLWLFLNQKFLDDRKFTVHIVLLSVSAALMVLIRHNSLVMLPAICLILIILCGSKLGKMKAALGVLPLILAFIFNPLIYGLFNVGRTYTGNTVLASDLTVMLRFHPELAAEFPLTDRHKDSPTVLIAEKNGGVWNDTIEGKPCPYRDKKICDPEMPLSCFGFKENTFNIEDNDCYMPVGKDNQALKDEYFRALTRHPFKLLNAKIYLFWQILRPVNWYPQPVNCEIWSGSSTGLKLNDTFTGPRETLCYLNHKVANEAFLNLISGVHLLWLILNFLFVIYFAAKFVLKREVKNIFLFLLFLIPLSYYLGYVAAATTPDYRFMYPATLMMQAMFVSFITPILLGAYGKSALSEDGKNYTIEDKKRFVQDNGDWTPEGKAKIVIEGLKGRSETDICREYDLDIEQYSKWRNEFLQNAATVFENNSTKQLEQENKQLKELGEELESKLKN